MSEINGITKDGLAWLPRFVDAINTEKCIGCGRCFRACGRDVLNLVGMTEEGEIVAATDDEAERKFMTIAHPEKCIGCEACSRVCPKDCYTHASMSLAVSVSA
ncbi:ferredoxin III, nif-specific [Acidithiobacillus sp. M4-SHS-6]|uniref:ferredoxin III, nif-specific n=1 Tax=Acidithiobacillus sp. M4-SHS-6 TaxID=3383024 RepID=UPI0039BDC592